MHRTAFGSNKMLWFVNMFSASNCFLSQEFEVGWIFLGGIFANIIIGGMGRDNEVWWLTSVSSDWLMFLSSILFCSGKHDQGSICSLAGGVQSRVWSVCQRGYLQLAFVRCSLCYYTYRIKSVYVWLFCFVCWVFGFCFELLLIFVIAWSCFWSKIKISSIFGALRPDACCRL
jgi:hypothetical protein